MPAGSDTQTTIQGSTWHTSAALTEADRLMTVCNACRYCEGLCAVFPAMEMRRTFPDGDLNYLANLCHGCGACYVDCQFSPPHAFDINVPKTLAIVRADSYAAYAWPRALAPAFRNNARVIILTGVACAAAFQLGFVAWNDPKQIWSVHAGPGAFYKLMPHDAMVALFGTVFLYAILALAMGVRAFWRSISHPLGARVDAAALWQAMKDAGRLRYLDGGGAGCTSDGMTPVPDTRRLYHHLTFYGFLLCFASTSLATLYHYLLGLEAPYPWYDLPVVLGTLGGLGLLIGPIGLLRVKRTRDPALQDEAQRGMETEFLVLLFLTSLTGLLLLVLRETRVMGVLLALHLGVVLALFLTMPYSKFVHGIYRFAALVRYALERRTSA
jgi:citrate/tricarballylate utilization protein